MEKEIKKHMGEITKLQYDKEQLMEFSPLEHNRNDSLTCLETSSTESEHTVSSSLKLLECFLKDLKKTVI